MGPCISCGHQNDPDKMFCETCGARLQNVPIVDDDDSFSEDSLSLMLGLVCQACDSYNDPGSSQCISCGTSLSEDLHLAASTVGLGAPLVAPVAPRSDVAPGWMSAPAGSPLATVNAMKAVDLSTLKSKTTEALAPPAQASPTPAVPAPAVPAPAVPAPAVAAPTFNRVPHQAPTFDVTLTPQPAATPTKACEKCSGELLFDDVFCKLCGFKQGQAQPSVSGTLMMSAVSTPSVEASKPKANATMMMPSLNLPAAGTGAAPGRPAATAFFGAVSADRFARLLLVKGHTQQGTQWRLPAGKTGIGRSVGQVRFPADPFLASLHCELEFQNGELWINPKSSVNGVFLKMIPGSKLPLREGDEFVVGTQRLRVLPDAERKSMLTSVDSHGTRLAAGAMRAQLPILVQRIGNRPSMDEVYARPQRLLTMGRAQSDLNFPTDPYISTHHARLTRLDNGSYELQDLNSRNGSFIRIMQRRKIPHGAQLMLGEQVMRIEINTLPQLG